MFRRAFIGSILLCALLVVPSAHAMVTTTWDFTNGKPIEGWQIDGLEVRQGPDGLHIRGLGVMMHTVDATHKIDNINLIFAKSVAGPAVLAWHRSSSPANEFMQLAVPLETASPWSQEIVLHKISEWDPWTNVIGFKFETNEEIVLSGIEFKGWSMTEKIATAWKSYWKPDRVLAFSINFLWGPLIVFTPGEIAGMYDTQPPQAWSAFRVTLVVLLLALLGSIIFAVVRRTQGDPKAIRRGIVVFFTIFAVLWVFHDIRMAYEFISNYTTDLRTYSFATPGTRSFRNLLTFHDGLEQNIDTLTSVPTYVVLAPDQSPMKKMAGYRTYPQSRPTYDEEPLLEAKVFYVFYDPRVSINEKQELVKNGVVISKPGHIANRIDPQAFIFVVP